MKTIVKKTVSLETMKHDFDNEFVYIEQWANSHLKDCYFAEKEFLFPDGSIKNEGKKYFYSPFSGLDIEKEIEAIDCSKFKWFDKLYFYDSEGEIIRIDGKRAEEVSYNFEEDEEVS